MNNGPQIQLRMMSNPLYLSGARELVSSVARRLGFTDMQCSQIALAVDEALCNVIKHGYDRREDAPIWLSMYPLKENGSVSALQLVIEDEARQVEVSQIKSRDLDDVRPGGLGVHIIREVMDEARYEKRGGTGMRLTLVKRLDSKRTTSLPPTCGDCGCGHA